MKTFMLMVVLAVAALTGCTGNQKQTAETVTESVGENSGITFEVAKNYFFKRSAEGHLPLGDERRRLLGQEGKDGARFLPTAKRIFGEYFEAFQIHHSDGDEHESNRHDVLRAFVRDHNLSATKYQDYGWPAKDLDL